MQRKSWVALAAVCLILGLIVGWLSASFIAAKDNEWYTDALSHVRYAQAEERATLLRLLENKDPQRAEELLYIVLNVNFKDYVDSANPEERERACELLKRLGPAFVASTQEIRPDQSKSRRALVESIRSATPKCDANVK